MPADQMLISFWGVRGTLPVPGKKSLIYGGNTNCVTVQIGEKHFFIFDAGTGIKELSNHLVKEKKSPIHAKIFISHPHYDHINGLPFFVPLYEKDNDFEIFGTNQDALGIDQLISNQMDTVYFPITIGEFAANLTFRDLQEEEVSFGDVKIKTIFLQHTSKCLGFRVEFDGKSFCYITDNEVFPEGSPKYNGEKVSRLIEFLRDTDVAVMDATYQDHVYSKKTGWGHSCVSEVINIADKANVKLICLYHHDPDDVDEDIADKLVQANLLLRQKNSATQCIAPKEGDKLSI